MNIRASQPTAFEKNADEQAVLAVLFALSFSHLVNDTIQSLVPSVYPILKASYHLDFRLVTDRRPAPFSLAGGMAFSLCGRVLLSRAPSYHVILIAAALVGVGSSIFHPEASRIARAASGGRYGFAQSLFQVGGYWGAALGPLLAAFIVVPQGQHAIDRHHHAVDHRCLVRPPPFRATRGHPQGSRDVAAAEPDGGLHHRDPAGPDLL